MAEAAIVRSGGARREVRWAGGGREAAEFAEPIKPNRCIPFSGSGLSANNSGFLPTNSVSIDEEKDCGGSFVILITPGVALAMLLSLSLLLYII